MSPDGRRISPGIPEAAGADGCHMYWGSGLVRGPHSHMSPISYVIALTSAQPAHIGDVALGRSCCTFSPPVARWAALRGPGDRIHVRDLVPEDFVLDISPSWYDGLKA